ncbi:MAG TPA: vWA domain-containing protein [Polyangiaceae bacterium]
MRRASILLSSSLSLVALATIYGLSACSPGPGQPFGATDPGGGSAIGGDTGIFGGGGGYTGGGGDGTGFGATMGSGTGATTTIVDGSACASDVHEGERLPLDMYFVVDTSGSMSQKVTGGTKWSVVSGSLVAFLNDPANADIGTGIGYFPVIKPGAPGACFQDSDCKVNGTDFGVCDGIKIGVCILCTCTLADGCDVPTYAAPSVPISLPPNHPAVVADIGKHGPGGGTPTRPALEGGMQYANSWAAANPGRNTIVVLATDGDPTGCMTNAVQDSANIAAAGLAGPNKIKTFVIGVGNSLGSLNQIAQAGGTSQAFVLDTGGDVAKSFSAALAAIHGQAASCDFKVPTTSDKGTVDLSTVNVSLAAKSGAVSVIPQTGTVDTCGDQTAWYFDNPSAPTLIKMCPKACDGLNQGGRIAVELGCKKTVKAPR